MGEQKIDGTRDIPTGEDLILSASFDKDGEDSGEPVTGDYPGVHLYQLTGATIKRVAVDVSGDSYVDPEREARAMLARE